MSLVALLETLKSKEIKLKLDDRGDLKIIGRRNTLDQALLTEIKEQKGVIIDWLKQETVLVRPRIVPRPRKKNELPPSFAQQRLWFIDQLDGGESPQYNLPGGMRIHGRFNEDIAERALHRIIERHEPLRTIFRDGEDGPVQHIRENFDFQLARLDLSGLSADEQEEKVQQAAKADAVKPFDLSADVMLRAGFIRLSEDEGVLLLNLHHIASDGWSRGILVNEISALYEAFSRGEPDPLPPLTVQYADYAQWQREWLAGEVLERQLKYWEQQLAKLPQVHGLALDRPRPAMQSFNGAIHTFILEHSTVAALKQLALQEQATLFMVLQAVFALLLARHSNNDDVVIGTAVANRLQKELESLVGFFVNTLVLRSDCSPGQTFREYLAQIKRMNLNAQANQDVPFEYLVERLKPQRSTSHAPLFQIMFNMNTNEGGAAESQELQFRRLRGGQVTVKFDLTLDAVEETDEVWLSFTYNTDLFDESTVVRLGEHFQNLARGVSANADQRIELLPLLSEGEQQHLLYELNDTATDFPGATCLHEMFEAQVELHPESVAVVFGDDRLTYRELNEQANQLAHYLRAQGIGPDTLVGLSVDRSLEMVVGMMGILKAGGAYVPLDPSYPPERLKYLIEDSAPAMLLTQTAIEERLLSNLKRLRLDADSELLADYPTHNPSTAAVGLTSEHLAYVIYTSGSTGQPKGAMLHHRGVRNRLLWGITDYQLGNGDAVLHKTPLSFDVSVWEIFAPLLSGARLVIAKAGGHQDPRYQLDLMAREKVTHVDYVPTMLEVLLELEGLDQCDNLKLVTCAGEPLTPELRDRFHSQTKAKLYNLYGPTEASLAVTYWVCDGTERVIPIGRPMSNVKIYILDQQLQPVPIGVAGELHIGGQAPGRGYLKRPDLTADKFIPDPFSDTAGQRLYKTGDLTRYRSDGAIEFLGRLDHQVKIRGMRMELGEVEAALCQHADVREALVLAQETSAGNEFLVAYVISKQEPLPTGDELRNYLKLTLPEYMVPARFVIMDQLPLLSNGKVDRKRLPAPEEVPIIEEYVAPATATEETLQTIWQELLALPSLSVTANFFEAGGHSILAIHLVKQVNKHFGEVLELRDIFQMQTIREMATYLDQQQHLGDKQSSSPQANLLELKQQQAPVKPLFLVHPVGGYSHCYLELALTLDFPGRVLGLQDDDDGPDVIEAMARKYIEIMRLEQSPGPYLLGGWSMGGVVAYEIARQLIAAGDSVDLLFMIDSYCPNPDTVIATTPAMREKVLLQTMASELGMSDEGLSLSERAALDDTQLPELMSLFIRLGKEQNRLPTDFSVDDLTRRYQMLLKNTRALEKYRALPLDIDIQLVRAQANRNPDRSLGWSSVAKQVTVHELGGDHFSLLRQPNVVELRKLTDKLLPGAGRHALI